MFLSGKLLRKSTGLFSAVVQKKTKNCELNEISQSLFGFALIFKGTDSLNSDKIYCTLMRVIHHTDQHLSHHNKANYVFPL